MEALSTVARHCFLDKSEYRDEETADLLIEPWSLREMAGQYAHVVTWQIPATLPWNPGFFVREEPDTKRKKQVQATGIWNEPGRDVSLDCKCSSPQKEVVLHRGKWWHLAGGALVQLLSEGGGGRALGAVAPREHPGRVALPHLHTHLRRLQVRHHRPLVVPAAILRFQVQTRFAS